MCASFTYQCYYEKHPRKRSKIVEANANHDLNTNPDSFIRHELPQSDRDGVEDRSKLRSMEANSGIAFTRLLGQRLSDSGSVNSAGTKLFPFGWNLGAGSGPRERGRPVTEFLSLDIMYLLARKYFENIHPLYGFLDKDFIMDQIQIRWRSPNMCKVPDHLLANIASGGSLFADDKYQHVIPALVEMAKRELENTSLMQLPTLQDAQSWLVRCLYLRATEHPHVVHMASATLMHLIEAIGLHQDWTSLTPNVADLDHTQDVDIRRRTFWIARMLNTWVSNEYGRTRVNLRGITAELPKPREGDYTTDYIQLYSLSSCLDPERDGESQWEDFLRQIERFEAPHDGIELSKANLAMCGYRRLRLASPSLSSETISRIIKIGISGLDAARRMVAKNLPWWHVANVPFQVVCVFLAMDVRESLIHVSAAIRVLEEVVERFKTTAMRDALKTARFLVRLSKKKKDEESDVLSSCLRKDGPSVDASDAEGPDRRTKTISAGPTEHTNGTKVIEYEAPATTSSEEWGMDLENLDIDWNFFLTTDMPVFDGLAPDGVM